MCHRRPYGILQGDCSLIWMSEITYHPTFQAPDVEEVNRLFPAYDVDTLIACGGMGAVYHATQRALDRPAAIKMLPREFSTDAEFRAGFESEAKAMAKLNHPNLIGVFDFGEVDGMLFIVMEFVPGKSLYEAAHGCTVDQAEALELAIRVCDGLAHAHESNILHRDIKPANILLDFQGNPKIGDFGLARPVDRQIEEGEQIFGTPGYTAPEVLEPPYTIDQRADIFSVGVVLHELLTGILPDADPRTASQIGDCSPLLDPVIRRAMHPDPSRRYTTATELAGELRKIAAKPTRTIRTGAPAARPATSGHSALSRPVSALSRPANALVTPARPAAPRPVGTGAFPARPKSPFNPTKTAHQTSSGSGLVIFLLLALIGCAVVFLVMKSGQKPATPQETPTPAPIPGGALPGASSKVPDAPSVGEETDPSDLLKRARISIRHRVSPVIESNRRDLKENVSAYRRAIEDAQSAASDGLSSGERKRLNNAISENFREWASGDRRISGNVPSAFRVISGAEDMHNAYLEKQSAIKSNLDREMKSLSGIYVLELQNQIEQLSRGGDKRAVQALEAEISTVSRAPERFRSIMGE
jgi:serine/threonine protein kinase